MNCVFRVDSAVGLGMGHVSRCLNLAERLRSDGHTVLFVCRQHADHFAAVVAARGFEVRLLPNGLNENQVKQSRSHTDWLGESWKADADETIQQIKLLPNKPEWLIVDHYGIDALWENAVRPFVRRILVVDDLANRSHSCDVLLDQNLVAGADKRYAGLIPEDCVQLLGPQWALLHSTFAELHERAAPRCGTIERIFVFLGGAPHFPLLHMIVKCALDLSSHVLVDVVVGSRCAGYDTLAAAFASYSNVRIHVGLVSLAPLMMLADHAIASGGVNTWERLCLGLPTSLITVAQNQEPAAAELQRLNLVQWLGSSAELSSDALAKSLSGLFSQELDQNWSLDCLRVVDGLGAMRVSEVLTIDKNTSIVVRSARLDDEALLLQWANDPGTRRNALQPGLIDTTTHRSWFRKRMRNVEGCLLYIAESTSGFPIGQVRFERSESDWEIHYSISPLLRGRGLGKRVLGAAMQQAARKFKMIALAARVKEDNTASAKIFKALDFELAREIDGVLDFRKTLTFEASLALEHS